MATGAVGAGAEPQVGAVYARLIVAAFFVLMVVAAIVWLQTARPRASRSPRRRSASARPPRPDPLQQQAQFAQIAMIIEAVMLGYSLSRRR